MEPWYFTPEVIQNIMQSASDDVVANSMHVSRQYREICQKNIWPLHYSVVKNDLPFFIRSLEHGFDYSKTVHGLSCLDLAIMYRRDNFISYMYDRGLLKQSFNFFQDIKFFGCQMTMFTSCLFHGSSGRLLSHSLSILDHSGFSSLKILDVPAFSGPVDSRRVVEIYFGNHEMFARGLRQASARIMYEVGDSVFDKKSMLPCMNDNLFSILNKLRFNDDFNDVIGRDDTWKAAELSNILNLIADLLERKVAILRRDMRQA